MRNLQHLMTCSSPRALQVAAATVSIAGRAAPLISSSSSVKLTMVHAAAASGLYLAASALPPTAAAILPMVMHPSILVMQMCFHRGGSAPSHKWGAFLSAAAIALWLASLGTTPGVASLTEGWHQPHPPHSVNASSPHALRDPQWEGVGARHGEILAHTTKQAVAVGITLMCWVLMGAVTVYREHLVLTGINAALQVARPHTVPRKRSRRDRRAPPRPEAGSCEECLEACCFCCAEAAEDPAASNTSASALCYGRALPPNTCVILCSAFLFVLALPFAALLAGDTAEFDLAAALRSAEQGALCLGGESMDLTRHIQTRDVPPGMAMPPPVPEWLHCRWSALWVTLHVVCGVTAAGTQQLLATRGSPRVAATGATSGILGGSSAAGLLLGLYSLWGGAPQYTHALVLLSPAYVATSRGDTPLLAWVAIALSIPAALGVAGVLRRHPCGAPEPAPAPTPASRAALAKKALQEGGAGSLQVGQPGATLPLDLQAWQSATVAGDDLDDDSVLGGATPTWRGGSHPPSSPALFGLLPPGAMHEAGGRGGGGGDPPALPPRNVSKGAWESPLLRGSPPRGWHAPAASACPPACVLCHARCIACRLDLAVRMAACCSAVGRAADKACLCEAAMLPSSRGGESRAGSVSTAGDWVRSHAQWVHLEQHFGLRRRAAPHMYTAGIGEMQVASCCGVDWDAVARGQDGVSPPDLACCAGPGSPRAGSAAPHEQPLLEVGGAGPSRLATATPLMGAQDGGAGQPAGFISAQAVWIVADSLSDSVPTPCCGVGAVVGALLRFVTACCLGLLCCDACCPHAPSVTPRATQPSSPASYKPPRLSMPPSRSMRDGAGMPPTVTGVQSGLLGVNWAGAGRPSKHV